MGRGTLTHVGRVGGLRARVLWESEPTIGAFTALLWG